MTPYIETQERSSKKTIVYICPRCNNKVNPQVENTVHGMTVQTADNSISYPGKRRTIITTKKRSYREIKKDPLEKFINEVIPGTNEGFTKVTQRTIERPGGKIVIKTYD
jgi:hypothetical protein